MSPLVRSHCSTVRFAITITELYVRISTLFPTAENACMDV